MLIFGFLIIFNGFCLDFFYFFDFNCIVMNKIFVLLIWNKFFVLFGDGIICGFNINYIDERYWDFFFFKILIVEFMEVVILSFELVIVYYF